MKFALVTLLTASSVYGIAIDSSSVAPALAGVEDGQARPNATTALDGQATPQVNATTLVKRSSTTVTLDGPAAAPGVNATTLVPNTVLDGPAAVPATNATRIASTSFIDGQATPQVNATTDN